MSNFINSLNSKKNRNTQKNNQPITSQSQKRPNSQIKYQKAPDIMTQAKPSYLNNFVQPINPHKSALTPTNHSNKPDNFELLLPQKSSEFSNKKTLILDLDETLVHSSFTPFEKNDIILNVDFEGVLYNIYVLVRPGTIEFIKKVSEFFEVIIFTASISKYALPLLDILDNEKKIKYRLTREHCTFINGIYIKELKKLNRNLKDVIIVDNSPLAYAFDAENGLPITTWYEDKEDQELLHIFPILQFLANVDDVRDYIYKFVFNNEIQYEAAYEIVSLNFICSNTNNNLTNTNTEANNNVVYANSENFGQVNNNNKKKNIKFVYEKSHNKSNSDLNYNNNVNNMKNDDKKIASISVNVTTSVKNKQQNKDRLKHINDLYMTPKNIIQLNNPKKNFATNINHNNNNSVKNSNLNINNSNFHTNSNICKGKDFNKEIQINIKKNIQIQRKKNAFRFGPKTQERFTASNNNINNINNISSTNKNIYMNNNNNHNFPLTLSLSNTTKNLIAPKKQIQYKTSKEKKTEKKIKNDTNENSKNIRSVSLKEILYEKKICKNNNWGGSISGATKKRQYTNLLEKLDNSKTSKIHQYSLSNNSAFTNSNKNLNKNSNQNKNTSNNKTKKYQHLRVVSYINSLQNNNKNNSITSDAINKYSSSFHVKRSKSTGNFLKFNKSNTQPPKTPKDMINYSKNLENTGVDIKKNTKFVNLLDGYGFSKSTRHKNVPESAKFGEGKYKNKKNGHINKIK